MINWAYSFNKESSKANMFEYISFLNQHPLDSIKHCILIKKEVNVVCLLAKTSYDKKIKAKE